MNLIDFVLSRTREIVPAFVFDVLVEDENLSRRLHNNSLLRPDELACYQHEVELTAPSIAYWEKSSGSVRKQIMDKVMECLYKTLPSKIIFAHLRHIKEGDNISRNLIMPAFTSPTVSKVLVGEEFLKFRKFVERYAAGDFKVTSNIITDQEVEMQTTE